MMPLPHLRVGHRARSARRPRHASQLHRADCTCRRCTPPPPRRPAGAPLSGNEIAARVLAGFGVGHLLAFVIDWAVGGPGLLPAWGL